ncbi:MAG: ClbS/DfsB family four-helix bundle protein [Nitriliruptor sp.]|nr:MAG: ClbS/DfsB family four-helix bundle protein [Nitriliruptor sp.]
MLARFHGPQQGVAGEGQPLALQQRQLVHTAGHPADAPLLRDVGWNQLPALNAQVRHRFAHVPLERIDADCTDVHDRLYTVVAAMTEEELFGRRHYPFTGSTTLAAYVTSASAAHYRSATKLSRWSWTSRQPTGTNG